MMGPLINSTPWLREEKFAYCLYLIFHKNQFFVIKMGTESYSVNRYNCHLRGEIRVLVAIETVEVTYSSNSLVSEERKVIAEREAGALQLGLK